MTDEPTADSSSPAESVPAGPDNPYSAPPPGGPSPVPPAPPPYAPPPGWTPPPPPYAAPPGWTPPPPPYAAPPGWQSPPPPYGAPPGWTPPGQYGGPPAGYPGYGYSPFGYPAQPSLNGFAIAALVCALALGIVPFLGGVLGVVLGIIGVRHCRRNGDRGHGLAVAGIAIGGFELVFWLIVVLAEIATSTGSSSGGLGALGY